MIIYKFLDLFKKFIALLGVERKNKLIKIIALVALMSILEAVGIGSIFPVLNAIVDPTFISENYFMRMLFLQIGLLSEADFVLFLALCSFLLIITSSVIKIFVTFKLNFFIHDVRHYISTALLDKYLKKNYSFYLEKNTSELGRNILGEVDLFSGTVITPLIHLISNIILAVMISALLLYFDYRIMLVLMLLFLSVYGVALLLLRKRLDLWGNGRLTTNLGRFKLASEIFQIIKILKISNLEKYYMQKFQVPSKQFSNFNAKVQTFSQLPRYLAEAITVGVILILIVFLVFSSGQSAEENFAKRIPILSVFALGALRLLPIAQLIYHGLSNILAGRAALENLHRELFKTNDDEVFKANFPNDGKSLDNELEVKNLSFKFKTEANYVLNNISFCLKRGEALGVVGESGAGKTTLIDILLGLYQATDGTFKIDGAMYKADELKNASLRFGYVPQDIVLIDSSLKKNIALGQDEAELDMEKLITCSKVSAIHNLAINELQHGYDTEIGERGVKLSGGQRQRIGIARALYSQPDILILDEATSALDSITEDNVLKEIKKNNLVKTIITVTHRMSNVKQCDKILVLESGRVAGYGTYKKLMSTCEVFKTLVHTQEKAHI